MPLFTRSSTAAAYRRGGPAVGSSMGDWRVGADDRAGPPPARRSALRVVMHLAVLLAGGGALYANPWILTRSVDWLWQQVETVRAWTPSPAQTDARVPPGERDTSAATPARALPAPSRTELPVPAEQTVRVPAPDAQPASDTPASGQPAATAASSADPGFNAPYAPPKPPVAEPFQLRAEAVGLHPEMSKAVLSRLSPADFQNARIAIDKLLAEASSDAVVVWPAQRRASEAQFRVHLVPGSDGADCRRYVVAIAKDGWLTTGLPMERCSALPASRKIDPK